MISGKRILRLCSSEWLVRNVTILRAGGHSVRERTDELSEGQTTGFQMESVEGRSCVVRSSTVNKPQRSA